MQETETVASIFDDIENNYFEEATIGNRFIDYIIDFAIFYIFNILIFALIGFLFGIAVHVDELQELLHNRLFTFTLTYINYTIFYTLIEGATKGRTIGKLITRTEAVKNDLNKITWKDALLRSLCRLVPLKVLLPLRGGRCMIHGLKQW